ncbi:hypothetical protein RZS08_53570, partial [Arthrospira platensis SPKY1]|nr:hypothetical protein [Arthrospira platensis SPKY1]
MAAEHHALRQAVDQAHAQGKPFRFWGTPDTPTVWAYALEIGVDVLNTDQPARLAHWLQQRPKSVAHRSQVNLP